MYLDKSDRGESNNLTGDMNAKVENQRADEAFINLEKAYDKVSVRDFQSRKKTDDANRVQSKLRGGRGSCEGEWHQEQVL